MKIDVDIELTSQQLAELFCEMNDDEQTRFFGDVAYIMSRWAPHARDMQIAFIGSHLVDCECGGTGARELIDGIHEAMTAAIRSNTRTKAPTHPVGLDEFVVTEAEEL